LLEQARVEVLAAREFPGMGINLAALQHEKWIRARPDGVIRGVGTVWVETFALIARVPLGAPLPALEQRMLATSWRSWMTQRVAADLQALAAVLDDQSGFARQARQIVENVLQAEAEASPALDTEPTRRDANESPQAAGSSAAASTAASEKHKRAQIGEEEGSGAQDRARVKPDAAASYRAYTTEFDAISTASELRNPAQLARRRRELDTYGSDAFAGAARWAHRLHRRLLAMQARSWVFDCEEGVLDASRLTRLVTRPLEPLAYKRETDVEFPDTIVSLLVDNSGSMRGEPIATAAACAEVLGRVLERCGVRTEILGFTTRSWQGGKARQKWVLQGRPQHPGRLADLQHVIYKSADEPWRRARQHLGLMLEDDLLKENVDGEALLWATQRLQRRSEPRQILIVISDGAPLDEATLAANDAEYLDRHLHAVIRRTQATSIELIAIGIGYDVTTYYQHAVKLAGVENLGETIVMQLIELFDAPRKRRKGSTQRRVSNE
jgi:cobaltochelatase CobT